MARAYDHLFKLLIIGDSGKWFQGLFCSNGNCFLEIVDFSRFDPLLPLSCIRTEFESIGKLFRSFQSEYLIEGYDQESSVGELIRCILLFSIEWLGKSLHPLTAWVRFNFLLSWAGGIFPVSSDNLKRFAMLHFAPCQNSAEFMDSYLANEITQCVMYFSIQW